MKWPFSKTRSRYKNLCPGSGHRGKWAMLYPITRGYDVCLVCGLDIGVRKQDSRQYKAAKSGTLKQHALNRTLTLRERFVFWKWRNR